MTSLMHRFAHLSSRDRRALLLGAAILVPLLGWGLGVRPWLASLEETRDRARAERALFDRERQVLAEAHTLAARLEETRVSLERADTRLLRAPNLALAEAELTTVVQGLARESRVHLVEARSTAIPPGNDPPPGLHPLRLSLRAESDFEGALALVHALEHDPLLLEVISLALSPAADPGALAITLVVEAHVAAPGTDPTQTDPQAGATP
jgi:hypothetical protein